MKTFDDGLCLERAPPLRPDSNCNPLIWCERVYHGAVIFIPHDTKDRQIPPRAECVEGACERARPIRIMGHVGNHDGVCSKQVEPAAEAGILPDRREPI